MGTRPDVYTAMTLGRRHQAACSVTALLSTTTDDHGDKACRTFGRRPLREIARTPLIVAPSNVINHV